MHRVKKLNILFLIFLVALPVIAQENVAIQQSTIDPLQEIAPYTNSSRSADVNSQVESKTQPKCFSKKAKCGITISAAALIYIIYTYYHRKPNEPFGPQLIDFPNINKQTFSRQNLQHLLSREQLRTQAAQFITKVRTLWSFGKKQSSAPQPNLMDLDNPPSSIETPLEAEKINDSYAQHSKQPHVTEPEPPARKSRPLPQPKAQPAAKGDVKKLRDQFEQKQTAQTPVKLKKSTEPQAPAPTISVEIVSQPESSIPQTPVDQLSTSHMDEHDADADTEETISSVTDDAPKVQSSKKKNKPNSKTRARRRKQQEREKETAKQQSTIIQGSQTTTTKNNRKSIFNLLGLLGSPQQTDEQSETASGHSTDSQPQEMINNNQEVDNNSSNVNPPPPPPLPTTAQLQHLSSGALTGETLQAQLAQLKKPAPRQAQKSYCRKTLGATSRKSLGAIFIKKFQAMHFSSSDEESEPEDQEDTNWEDD